MLCIAPMTEAKKPGLRGEREGNRKTIAQGVPDRFGVPVVTTLVCFFPFAREAAGALGHPAFPAPSSCLLRDKLTQNSDALRVPRTGARVPDAAQRFL